MGSSVDIVTVTQYVSARCRDLAYPVGPPLYSQLTEVITAVGGKASLS